tara:strand:- start:27812 stop:28018 length:207 start_codon:yes stop_codon:yes gene_type:complete
LAILAKNTSYQKDFFHQKNRVKKVVVLTIVGVTKFFILKYPFHQATNHLNTSSYKYIDALKLTAFIIQ